MNLEMNVKMNVEMNVEMNVGNVGVNVVNVVMNVEMKVVNGEMNGVNVEMNVEMKVVNGDMNVVNVEMNVEMNVVNVEMKVVNATMNVVNVEMNVRPLKPTDTFVKYFPIFSQQKNFVNFQILCVIVAVLSCIAMCYAGLNVRVAKQYQPLLEQKGTYYSTWNIQPLTESEWLYILYNANANAVYGLWNAD